MTACRLLAAHSWAIDAFEPDYDTTSGLRVQRIQAVFRGCSQRAADEREFDSLMKQAETMMMQIAAQREGNDPQQEQVVGALLERLRQQRQIIERVRQKQLSRLPRSTSGVDALRRGKSVARASSRETSRSRHLLPTTSRSNQMRLKHATPQPQVKLQLADSEKLQRQTAQIGKVLRDAIASKRSVNGQAVDSIRSVFKSMDKDGSGTLDKQEFSVAMTRLGLGLTDRQVQQCIEVLDADKDGTISLTEFLVLVHDSGPPKRSPRKVSPRSATTSKEPLTQETRQPNKQTKLSTPRTSHTQVLDGRVKRSSASRKKKKGVNRGTVTTSSDDVHAEDSVSVLPRASSAYSAATSTPPPRAKKRSAKKKGATGKSPRKTYAPDSNIGKRDYTTIVKDPLLEAATKADPSPGVSRPHACLQFAMGWQWPLASTHLLLGRYSESNKPDTQKGLLLFKSKTFSRRHAIIRECARSPAPVQEGVWREPRFEIEVLSKNGLAMLKNASASTESGHVGGYNVGLMVVISTIPSTLAFCDSIVSSWIHGSSVP